METEGGNETQSRSEKASKIIAHKPLKIHPGVEFVLGSKKQTLENTIYCGFKIKM